jgi:hypothetical protein
VLVFRRTVEIEASFAPACGEPNFHTMQRVNWGFGGDSDENCLCFRWPIPGEKSK